MNPKPNLIIIGVSFFDGMASSTRVRNLLRPLINKGLVTICNLIYKKDSNAITANEGIIDDVPYKVIGFSKSNPFSILTFTWNGIKFIKRNKKKEQKNIIYNYDQPDLRNIVLLMYAKLIGYKIVLDIIEDNRFYTTFPRLLTKIKIKSSIFFIKRAPLFANAIFAISHHIYQEMKKISKDKIDVYLIPITVNMEKFPIKKYYVPEEYTIFYGGSFGSKDGLENLIKAFEIVAKKHDNIKLVLTGRGADHDMIPLHNLITRSGVNDKIIFKGYLSSDDYYATMNECDIFCMTRINSQFANAGFPFKLGEFLATGRAVIATRIGEIEKYLVNNENALLIQPSSIDELSHALEHILQNPFLINDLGLEARKTAETYFDSEKVSSKLLSVFQNL